MDIWDDSNLKLGKYSKLIRSEGAALPHLVLHLSHDSILLNYLDYFSNILLNH